MPRTAEEAPAGSAGGWDGDAAVAEEAEAGRENSTEGGVASVLRSQPLFRGLGEDTLDEIADLAELTCLAPGEVLELADGVMFVVEAGAIELIIGFGPAVTVRKGTVLNVAGMLGLGQALATSSHAESDPQGAPGQRQPYEVLTHVATFEHLSKWKINAVGQHQSPCFEESACMTRLCPEAAAQIQSPGRPLSRRSTNAAIASRSQQVTATCVPEARVPETDPERSEPAGARIRCIGLPLIEEVLSRQSGDGASSEGGALELPGGCLARFQSNRQDLLEKAWAISRCSLFPDAPAEVVWSLAELSELHRVHPGQKVISEGEAGESLVIIAQGEATADKIVGDATKAVGRVGSGAIIGDICLVGVNVPRPATVVANTEVRALEVPASALLAVLGRFPGLTAQMVHRLTASTRQLQAGLPPWMEVLSTVKVFSKSELHFLNALARVCERHVFYCGAQIREADGNDGSLYVVQHGSCSMEDAESGQLSYFHVSSCFGWNTPVGTFGSSNGAVRAVTPIVVVLQVPKTVFLAVLTRYPGESKRLCHRGATPEGSTLRNIIGRMEIFGSCGPDFLQEVEQAAGIMYYMPNQTLCVEGSVDEAHMMYLRGGQACLERHGKGPIVLQGGSTFGERAFLGVVRRRTATIRALTLCVTVEISRASVLTILDRHPKERQLFEQLAMQSISETGGIRWPILKGATSQLSFMLNLYAERRVLAKGDLSAGTFFAGESVILLMHGQLAVVNADGKEVEHLMPGSCFNEQILLDVPHVSGMYYVPKTSCEVQIIRKEMWKHVMASFPQEVEMIRKNIVKVMAGKAEQKLGYEAGSTGVLFCSALFRTVSADFAGVLRAHLEEAIYEPGQVIIEDGAEGESMYILLDGEATAKSCGSSTHLELAVGKAFGEAVLLGAAKIYNCTVQAVSHCVVYMLRRCHWESVLGSHPAELQLFEEVLREAGHQGYCHLQQRLQRSPTFRRCESGFLATFFTHAIHSFFAPGEELSDDCYSSPFVLLAGLVTIKDKLGFTLSEIKPGEMFGEAECLGCEDLFAASAHAAKQGLVHCVQLHKESMKAALRDFPAECKSLRERFVNRQAVHASATESRYSWLREIVLPTLRGSVIFSPCSDELILRIAVGLSPTHYDCGDVICVVGVPANAMLFLIEGTADIVSREGRTVGRVTKGAWVDEVVALGLFRLHIATVRASSACTVLAIPAKAIADAEQGEPGEDGAPRGMFQQLRESRRAQVAQALPISALPLNVGADDVAARAVALQAERISLSPGERLMPLSDASPCGPHFLVVVRGRATVEMASSGLPVQNVTRGTPISEGLAAEHGACIRALNSCEAYRVRHSDFRAAVGTDVKWLGDFLNLERQSWDSLQERLKAAEGVGRLLRSCKRSVSTSHVISPSALRLSDSQPLEEETLTLTSPSRPVTPISPSSLPSLAQPPASRPKTCAEPGRYSPLRRAHSSGRVASHQRRDHMAGMRSILQLRRDLRVDLAL